MTPFWTWVEQAHRDWPDTDSRPLGEVSSARYPPETRLAACPYSGARRGLPMNLDALDQVRAHQEAGLATITRLVAGDPTVGGMLRACCSVVTAPLFGPVPVPSPVAALYKTTLGFHQVLVSLLLDTPGLVDTRAADLPSGAALLDSLDGGRWLVGQSQVCSGSPGEIARMWEVLCGRRTVSGVGLDVPPREEAVEWTALVLALVLATHERLARGDTSGTPCFGEPHPPVDTWPLGARLWYRRPAPWLVSATARPDRLAASVRNLGSFPSIEPLLAETGDHAALERTFRSVTR